MSKQINQLTAATSAEAKNDSYIFPLQNPIAGDAVMMSIGQAKEVFATKKLKYVATGGEGSTLTIPTIQNYSILLITRGMGIIYEVGSSPDSDEFTWNSMDIGLGTPVSTGEKFNILYRTT